VLRFKVIDQKTIEKLAELLALYGRLAKTHVELMNTICLRKVSLVGLKRPPPRLFSQTPCGYGILPNMPFSDV